MPWHVFDEEPGECEGDDVLLEFIESRLEVPVIDEWDEFAALTWTAGRPQLDHPFIREVLAFAWKSCDDESLQEISGGKEHVRQRLADLGVKMSTIRRATPQVPRPSAGRLTGTSEPRKPSMTLLVAGKPLTIEAVAERMVRPSNEGGYPWQTLRWYDQGHGAKTDVNRIGLADLGRVSVFGGGLRYDTAREVASHVRCNSDTGVGS